MNKRFFIVVLITSIFLFIFDGGASCMTRPESPTLVVAQDTFEFSAVPAGRTVVHDFIVQNTGDAPLIIKEVESDCGCTAVEFSRQIPPNGKGKVSVQLNTVGYGGNFITKYVEIFSSDPKKPVTILIIKGRVDKFIKESEPLFARLKGVAGRHIETKATITSTKKHPFKIVSLKTRKKGNISVVLKHFDEAAGGVKYVLEIQNLRTTPGRYHDLISVRTDSIIRPELKVFVYADIRTKK